MIEQSRLLTKIVRVVRGPHKVLYAVRSCLELLYVYGTGVGVNLLVTMYIDAVRYFRMSGSTGRIMWTSLSHCGFGHARHP